MVISNGKSGWAAWATLLNKQLGLMAPLIENGLAGQLELEFIESFEKVTLGSH